MKFVLAVAALLALSGCQSMMTPEQIAQADDQTCRSYGAQPGSDAYMACRLQQQRIRVDQDAQQRAAASALGRSILTQQQPRPTMNCTSSANILGGYNTSCF